MRKPIRDNLGLPAGSAMVGTPDHDRMARTLGDLRPETLPLDPEWSRRTFHDRMDDLATPGASIAVLDGFDIAWTTSAGTRREDVPAPVESNTPFQAGSISKPVFALAVMRLCQDGVLDLDAEIGTYLTSWRLPDGDNGWSPRVSLRQLLSHTAGTTVHGFPGYPAGGPCPTLRQVLDGARPANTQRVIVDAIPGTQFRYSGGGTTIAQLVVEETTRRPLPDLMRDLVLAPLGMGDSSFEQPPSPDIAARAAHGHPWNGVPVPGGWHVYPEMAAAGLWTTAADLARLGAAVLKTLRGDRTPLGLRPETLAAMLKPQLPGQVIGDDFVGLGWFCYGKGDGFHFGHQGADEGFLAQLRLYPATGRGAAVMINSIQGWPLLPELLDSIGREYGWPVDCAAVEAPDLPVAADLAGCYRDKSGREFHVEKDGTHLLMRAGSQPPVPLETTADGSFVARIPKLRIRFSVMASGEATMTMAQGGMSIEAVKATP